MSTFEALVHLLKNKGLKISAAESCTGGLFASKIVEIADASKVLDASFVTYAPWAKTKFAFVNPDTITAFGVVSEQVASEMARGAAENASSQVGVGITGYAGPSGGDSFAKRGTVCFGFYVNGKQYAKTLYLPQLSRNPFRERSAEFAAQELLAYLNME